MSLVYLSVLEVIDVVKAFNHPGVMGNRDDCGAIFSGDSFEQGHNFRAPGSIQRCGGFVGQDEPGVVGRGPGDGHALLFPPGKEGRKKSARSAISMYSMSSWARACAAGPWRPIRFRGHGLGVG